LNLDNHRSIQIRKRRTFSVKIWFSRENQRDE